MSFEEDTELRDIVMETLDQRGVVGKAKAMLRAHIFTALEETTAPEDKISLLNKKMKDSLATDEGKLMAELIIDYFNCFDLEFSKTVFSPETGYSSDRSNRSDLCHSLGISIQPEASSHQPLLATLLNRAQAAVGGGAGGDKSTSRTPASAHYTADESVSNLPRDLTSKQISDAREKFQAYDKDGNGTIDKDELRLLFIDMFPAFHRNMLERYVTDEFQAADTDFSAGINFDEFLSLYKRLFVICRSVVSHDVSEITTPTLNRSPSPRQSKIPVKSDGLGSPASRKDSGISPRLQSGSTGTASSRIPHLISTTDSVTSAVNASASASTTASSDPVTGTTTSSGPASSLPLITTVKSGGITSSATTDTHSSSSDSQAKSLTATTSESKDKKAAGVGRSGQEINKSLADLGFEVPDDEEESIKTKSDDFYDDDFERSNASSNSKLSRKSYSESIKTADSVSTEDITDKIQDDDDDLDALLKDNDISWGNETTDKSITDDESLKGADYWELAASSKK